MRCKLEIHTMLCATSKFEINDIKASVADFGDSSDHEPEEAQDRYSCGNRIFTGFAPAKKTLDKYSINTQEYETVVAMLEKGLSFGECGLCS